jgi:AbrB family looped-hinge helix DNA binding protein
MWDAPISALLNSPTVSLPFSRPQENVYFAIIVLMRIKIVTVSRKGQITIPQALRERMRLQPGDTVEIWVEKGSIYVQPVKPRPQQSHTA